MTQAVWLLPCASKAADGFMGPRLPSRLGRVPSERLPRDSSPNAPAHTRLEIQGLALASRNVYMIEYVRSFKEFGTVACETDVI